MKKLLIACVMLAACSKPLTPYTITETYNDCDGGKCKAVSKPFDEKTIPDWDPRKRK